jgi:hypothetical protein
MRVKFEATDATGKVHKRSSTSHVYSHCLLIHFAAHPPTKLWPKGISACSHAEWAESRAPGRAQGHSLAQGASCRGHRNPRRNSSVMFPSKTQELASRFNGEAYWSAEAEPVALTA